MANAAGSVAQEPTPREATAALYAKSDRNTFSNACSDDDVTFSSPTPSFPVAKYHLLWSPGAWKKLVVGTSTLFIAHAASQFMSSSNLATAVVAPSFLTTFSTNFLLPMLASACCLLQLGLNLLSVGCAGFNTILGPLRPYSVSLLLYLTVLSRFSKHAHYSSVSSWAMATAGRWGLALLPELLHLWNNRDDYLTPKNRKLAATKSYDLNAVVVLDIPTMGCVACINKIDQALGEVGEQVLTAKSQLKESGGETHVQIVANSHSEIHALAASLSNVVSKAGFFGSTIQSVQMKQNTGTITST